MKQRFFVRLKERATADTQELAAMLLHRLRAIDYHEGLLRAGDLHYAFLSGERCTEAILLFEVENHERLDWLLKRDPHFAYASRTVIPTVLTDALVREAQDYLGEAIFSEEEIPSLRFPKRDIDPAGEYWLAWKEVPPFSPLCPVEVQDDVHRRTILAQKGHFDVLEFADDNPVGMPVGILVAEAPLDQLRQHVESCDVFPDTIVQYERIWTHAQAREMTRRLITELRRPLPDGMV